MGRQIPTAGELALKRLLCWKELLTHKERRQADAAWGGAGSEQGLLMKSGHGHWMQEKLLHIQGMLSSEWAQERNGLRYWETGLGKKLEDPGMKQMGKEKCRCQWGYQVTGQANREETVSEKRKEKHLKREISGFFLLCPI